MSGINKRYGGIIWTNHATQRLYDRGIKQGDAYSTFRSPHETRRGNSSGAWVYYRNFQKERIEVVAKKNEHGEWLILSVWSKPVYEKYQYKAKRKSGFWNWFWRILTG